MSAVSFETAYLGTMLLHGALLACVAVILRRKERQVRDILRKIEEEQS